MKNSLGNPRSNRSNTKVKSYASNFLMLSVIVRKSKITRVSCWHTRGRISIWRSRLSKKIWLCALCEIRMANKREVSMNYKDKWHTLSLRLKQLVTSNSSASTRSWCSKTKRLRRRWLNKSSQLKPIRRVTTWWRPAMSNWNGVSSTLWIWTKISSNVIKRRALSYKKSYL